MFHNLLHNHKAAFLEPSDVFFSIHSLVPQRRNLRPPHCRDWIDYYCEWKLTIWQASKDSAFYPWFFHIMPQMNKLQIWTVTIHCKINCMVSSVGSYFIREVRKKGVERNREQGKRSVWQP